MDTRKDKPAAGDEEDGEARSAGIVNEKRDGAKRRKTSKSTARATSAKRADRQDDIAPAVPYDPRLMEQQFAAVHRLLEEHDFATIDEANAFLQQLVESGGPPPATPTTPLEQAQDMIYQALKVQGEERVALARKALAISPDCADAYVLLAEASRSPEEARPFYEQGVAAGERALGPEVFAEDVGEFWGLLETRPYMRARQGLAEALWELDERQAAIEHAQEMLRLNPNDNQGMRYLLASWLLAVGEDAALETLLAQYPEEGSAHWAYTRALFAFRRHGSGKEAETALAQALQANPYVPMYLLGVAPWPQEMPSYYGMGDENEAIVYLSEAAEPWTTTERAADWLATSLPRLMGAMLGEPPRRRASTKRSAKLPTTKAASTGTKSAATAKKSSSAPRRPKSGGRPQWKKQEQPEKPAGD